MRRIAIIVLIFTICFNSLGYYVCINLIKKQVKKEIKSQIKQGVPQQQLITIILSQSNSNQFKWLDKKEFLYNGVMYDIVKSDRLKDGKQIFYCINDTQETKLFKHLRIIVNESVNGNPSNRSAVTLLYLFIGGLFFEEAGNFKPAVSSISISFGSSFSCYIMPVLSKVAPPPKVF